MRFSLLVVHNIEKREERLENIADFHRVFVTSLDDWSKIVTPPSPMIRVTQNSNVTWSRSFTSTCGWSRVFPSCFHCFIVEMEFVVISRYH